MTSLRILLCSIVAILPFTTSVLAQEEDADRIEKRYQEPNTPKSTPEELLPIIQDSIAPEQAEQIRFVLKAIQFTGNTVYSDNDLNILYQHHINQAISLTDIYSLINTITSQYGKAGYTLSRAYVETVEI